MSGCTCRGWRRAKGTNNIMGHRTFTEAGSGQDFFRLPAAAGARATEPLLGAKTRQGHLIQRGLVGWLAVGPWRRTELVRVARPT